MNDAPRAMNALRPRPLYDHQAIRRWIPLLLLAVPSFCRPAAAYAIDLNVYILTGQSNALGTTFDEGAAPAQYGPGTDPNDANTRFFWSNVNASNTVYPPVLYGDSGGAITTLRMQQGNNIPQEYDPAFWGPEFGFARTMMAAGQSNVFVIKVSRGGGGNTLWDKAAFAVNPNSGHMWGALQDGIGGDQFQMRLLDDNGRETVDLGAGSANDFHTLELVGLAGSNAFNVFVDGQYRFASTIPTVAGAAGFENRAMFNSGSTGGVGRDVIWNEVSLAVATPERSSLVLVGTGLLAVAAFTWRKRKNV